MCNSANNSIHAARRIDSIFEFKYKMMLINI